MPEKQDGIDVAGSASLPAGSLTRAIVALDERAGDAEALYETLLEWAVDVKGVELYEAQEEAIMELVEGNSVLLTTPTGSGKTLVATAAVAAAVARGDVGRPLSIDGHRSMTHRWNHRLARSQVFRVTNEVDTDPRVAFFEHAPRREHS